MTERPTLVILSPHPDDAVLAVGGLLTHYTRLGGHVVIVTVFAGSPPDHMSSLARHLYADDPHRDEITHTRRLEDLAAGHQVHAQVVQLPHLEALYRSAPDGTPLYTNLRQIFSAPTTEVEATAEHLARHWLAGDLLPANADIVTPLGIGGHVDHRIVRRAAETAHDLAGRETFRLHYYEDQPYASRRQQQRWHHLIPQHSAPTVHPITDAEWQQKIDAIACHTSQIALLWPNGQSFQDELRSYADTVGDRTLAERTWSPGPPIRSG
jgi:LmbE family N-acetylglucosaminyl deacetylase